MRRSYRRWIMSLATLASLMLSGCSGDSPVSTLDGASIRAFISMRSPQRTGRADLMTAAVLNNNVIVYSSDFGRRSSSDLRIMQARPESIRPLEALMNYKWRDFAAIAQSRTDRTLVPDDDGDALYLRHEGRRLALYWDPGCPPEAVRNVIHFYYELIREDQAAPLSPSESATFWRLHRAFISGESDR